MFYRYNSNDIITEKSNIELAGNNVCISDIDFDIDFYDIYIGLIDDKKKVIYYTTVAKSSNELVPMIKNNFEKTNALEYELTNTQLALTTQYEENIKLQKELLNIQLALVEIYEKMEVK